MQNSMTFCQILDVELHYDPTISLMNIYPKENWYTHSQVQCSITWNDQDMKTKYLTIDEWIKKT